MHNFLGSASSFASLADFAGFFYVWAIRTHLDLRETRKNPLQGPVVASVVAIFSSTVVERVTSELGDRENKSSLENRLRSPRVII
jgi:hypothetical protein